MAPTLNVGPLATDGTRAALAIDLVSAPRLLRVARLPRGATAGLPRHFLLLGQGRLDARATDRSPGRRPRRRVEDVLQPVDALGSRAEVARFLGQRPVVGHEQRLRAVARADVEDDVEQRVVCAERAGVVDVEAASDP